MEGRSIALWYFVFLVLTYLYYIVNTNVADDLAPQAAWSSVAMGWPKSQNIPLSIGV